MFRFWWWYCLYSDCRNYEINKNSGVIESQENKIFSSNEFTKYDIFKDNDFTLNNFFVKNEPQFYVKNKLIRKNFIDSVETNYFVGDCQGNDLCYINNVDVHSDKKLDDPNIFI